MHDCYDQLLMKATAACSRVQVCGTMQNEAQSQYSELLSQSQAELSVGQEDEGDTDREIRELTQQLVEAQQEVMTAQAECDRALRTEQEAFEAWDSKRSAYWFWCPPCLLTRRANSGVRLYLAVHHLGIVCCMRTIAPMGTRTSLQQCSVSSSVCLSLPVTPLVSNACLCCRSDGSRLQDDNDCINNEIHAQELAVQDAKAQLHYYECHQHDTNQKVRGCKSLSAQQNVQRNSQSSGHACCIFYRHRDYMKAQTPTSIHDSV